MNRTIYTAIACIAVGLAAHLQSTASAQTPPVVHVTVIGCVEPADQSAASGRTTDSKYKLTHAKSGKSDSTSTTGTGGSASRTQTATTYHLDNAKDSTLAQDVGNQVEMVAVIEPDTPAPTGTTGLSTAAANEPKLKVESVKVIAAGCPE
jgi:hypothetical protein